jgi:hypothetical protein
LVALDDNCKHGFYPYAYAEATAQAATETQSHREPHHHPQHRQDTVGLYAPEQHEYPNSWADQGVKWAKDCMGTCKAGKCHVSPYDLKQCVGRY